MLGEWFLLKTRWLNTLAGYKKHLSMVTTPVIDFLENLLKKEPTLRFFFLKYSYTKKALFCGTHYLECLPRSLQFSHSEDGIHTRKGASRGRPRPYLPVALPFLIEVEWQLTQISLFRSHPGELKKFETRKKFQSFFDGETTRQVAWKLKISYYWIYRRSRME